MDELKRLTRILELVRAALRDEVAPGPVLAPMVNYVINGLMDLTEALGDD